jgi:hypothetical protein
MSPDSSFFAQPADSAKPYAGASVSDASSSLVSADAKSASRSIPTLSYAELDAHIADLARLSEKAMADGDPHGSHLFAMEMYRAIKSRCLAHQAILHAEADRRIDEGVNYFDWQGKLDAERMNGAR